MYDLTQLEQAGYRFTPLEKLVFENPSFQFLYGKWPIKWGSLTTGLAAHIEKDYYQREVISLKPIDREKLTPHGSGTFFDKMSSHIRSVLILATKVARDASMDKPDQDLVQDLSLWLDGVNTYHKPFRWVRFEQDHLDKLRREVRSAEVARLSQGDANVVVLLLDKLAQDQRLIIRNAMEADCLRRGIFGEGDDQARSRYYHLPQIQCMTCPGSQESGGGGRHCDNPSSIVLIDCGDVPTIIKSVPADFRRIVKPVRFKVPKSTFSDRFQPCVGTDFFPQFAVFSLQLLSKEEQQEFRLELEKGLLREQRGGIYGDSRIIAPYGRQKNNALLQAGLIATWSTWSYLLKGNDLWYKLLKEKKIRVDLIGS